MNYKLIKVGGYPGVFSGAPRPGMNAAGDGSQDEWEASKKSMSALLERSKRMVNFRDLAAAMEITIGELYTVLGDMTDPTEEFATEF